MENQPVTSSLSPRTFIQGAVVSSAVSGFPSITRSKSPNGKLVIGLIGVGGRGRGHVTGCRNEQLVALCDINKKHADGATRFPWCKDARTTIGFRYFYQKIEDLDVVVVSTTEHIHAFTTLPALEAKKHVYCERPLPVMFMNAASLPGLPL